MSELKPFAEIVAQEDAAIATDILLAEVMRMIGRFMHMTAVQLLAVSLWVMHTHAIEAADTTPYLAITSPEKGSGKTTLLETLDLLVNESWYTGRTTAAALVRKTDARKPTLLLDESDAAFKGDKEYSETLRGVLNTGYRRGGAYTVCVGQGKDIGFRDFETFGPKAIAGIGDLPDTVADRSIPIRLERKTGQETVERFRRRDVAPDANDIRRRMDAWAAEKIESLRGARPDLPDELGDRSRDVWEPLLAIADLAGPEWGKQARRGAVSLSSAEEKEDESIGVRLLRDIRTVFAEQGSDKITAKNLLEDLTTMEDSSWEDWYGKPITVQKVGQILKRFRIKTMSVWIDNRTIRGYQREQFIDAWARYLPPPNPEEGVRGIRGVRSGSAPEAPPNTPTTLNALSGNGHARLTENERAVLDGFEQLVASGEARWIDQA